MKRPIQRAVVIGAGTMGAQIAAHLANAGVRTHLLDILPPEPTPEDERAGLSLEDERVRNRLARQGLEAAQRASPAAFFTDKKVEWITIGNLEDDLGVVAESDWVIEAIVEDLEIKRGLMARLDALRGEGTIVSTNTSGIPVNEIAAGRSDPFLSHFLGTHFFNPPRYLKLMEVIPAEGTDPEVVARIEEFVELRLGKGVVRCN